VLPARRVGAAAAELQPLHDHLLAQLKTSPKLFCDETRLPVLDPGRGKSKTGFLWALARDDQPWAGSLHSGSGPPAVVYAYAPGRGAEHAIKLLDGFSGTLQIDSYAAFMEKRKVRIITTKLAMEWATLPPVGMLPGWKRAKPYVYSDAEIDALLAPALALPPEDRLRRWTYHTLFGLIAVTGMRISEAMGLERDDVDLDAGVLTVRLTKFGKSRLVPLHPRTCTALRSWDHAAVRPSSLPSRAAACCTSTFVASSGGCPERPGCGAQVIVPGRACTTSVIASLSGRCSTGIAKAKTSSSNFRHSPPTSATPACAIPTGISRPAPSRWKKRRGVSIGDGR
jgi:hypothetical protein